MKPYRIKHKATGLYYQPLVNGNNLSKTGKVYLNWMDVLNGTDNYIFISFNPSSKLYNDYKSFFPDGSSVGRLFTCRVLKTEFEKEEL